MIKVSSPKFVLSLFLAALIFGSCGARDMQGRKVDVKTYLQNYFRNDDVPGTRYSVASVSLKDKKQDYFVYLSGMAWCGTSGCTGFLMEKDGYSYKIIQKFLRVRLPVIILNTRTNRWRDIAMPVAGGGIKKSYTVILKFDGKKYRYDLKAPQKELDSKGNITIPLNEIGKPLYQNKRGQ